MECLEGEKFVEAFLPFIIFAEVKCIYIFYLFAYIHIYIFLIYSFCFSVFMFDWFVY